MFIKEKQYGLWLNDELSVSCYYLNKRDEGIDLINEVLNLPERKFRKQHYINNLEFFNKL